jgi:DNA polymerase III subunit delta
VATLTLVVGDEDLLAARAVSRAVAAATGGRAQGADRGADPSAGVGEQVTMHDVAAGGCSPDDLAEMLAPSLFADERVIVLRELQDTDSAVADLLAQAVGADDPGLAVIAAHLGGAKGKAVLAKLRPLATTVVEVRAVRSPREREQFVIDEVRATGADLDRDAAAELVGAVGTDLRELATAAAQLSADVGGQITAADVATYYRGRAESSGFAVADRAVEGDVGAALETLRWAFATGLDPILVSSSLAANLRLIATVGAAGPGSPEALAAKLRMPAWKIRRAQTWLRRWRPEGVAEAIRAVAVADADLKGAGDDPAYAVERAVLAVAGAAGRVT